MKIFLSAIVGGVVTFLLALLSFQLEFQILPPRGNFIINLSGIGAILLSVYTGLFGLIIGALMGKQNFGFGEKLLWVSLLTIIFIWPVAIMPPKFQYDQDYFDWHAFWTYILMFVRALIIFPLVSVLCSLIFGRKKLFEYR